MTDPSNPYASLPLGGQAPTWQAPQYGHSQPGYDQAPYGYGQGAYGQAQYGYGQAPYGYGQPVYGQPGYVAPYDSRYDGIERRRSSPSSCRSSAGSSSTSSCRSRR